MATSATQFPGLNSKDEEKGNPIRDEIAHDDQVCAMNPYVPTLENNLGHGE